MQFSPSYRKDSSFYSQIKVGRRTIIFLFREIIFLIAVVIIIIIMIYCLVAL